MINSFLVGIILGIIVGVLVFIFIFIVQVYLDKRQLNIRKFERKIRGKTGSGIMYAETPIDIAQKKIIKKSNKEEGTKLSNL